MMPAQAVPIRANTKPHSRPSQRSTLALVVWISRLTAFRSSSMDSRRLKTCCSKLSGVLAVMPSVYPPTYFTKEQKSNKLAISGRLVGDPEVKILSNGTMLTTITIAVDSGSDRPAQFFDCEAWKVTAQAFSHAQIGDE